MLKNYAITRTTLPLDTLESWHDHTDIPAILIDQFRPESSSHRPHTSLKLAYDNMALYGLFEVADRYVRCVNTTFQSPTHHDSCVELFLQPDPIGGYFNFEWNCSGTLAVFYITDHTRTVDGFAAFSRLQAGDVVGVKTFTTLKGIIDPELAGPLEWLLSFKIEFAALRSYLHFPDILSGQTWRANAFKCADQTSHPHWSAWAPVPELNFHLPESFGQFQFL